MKTSGFNSWVSWKTAVAGSCVQFWTVLPFRCVGLFYVEMLDRYDTNRENAAYPMTCMTVAKNVAGPLVGFAGEKLGLRFSIILGCLFSIAGIGLCYFAEGIAVVTVGFGLLQGIGISLTFSLIPQVLKYHFNENVAFANGLAIAGASLSGVLMTPLVDFLLKTYGLSGTFLLLSAMLLHSIPAAIFLKVPIKPSCAKNNLRLNDITRASCDRRISTIYEADTLVEDESSAAMIAFPHGIIQQNITSEMNGALEKRKMSIESSSGTSETSGMLEDYTINVRIAKSGTPLPQCYLPDRRTHVVTDFPRRHSSVIEGLFETKQNCDQELRKPTTNKKQFYHALHIFIEPQFILIALISAVHAFGIVTIWTIIVDFARDKQILRSEEVYFPMCMPLAELIGTMGLNWITDRSFMKLMNYVASCFILQGLVFVYMVWVNSFTLLIIGVAAYGVIYGSMAAVFPVMIFKYIEDDKQTMAQSSRVILLAPVSFSIGPLVGYFRGQLGSYDGIFYLMTALSILSAFLSVLIPACARYQRKRSNRSARTSIS